MALSVEINNSKCAIPTESRLVLVGNKKWAPWLIKCSMTPKPSSFFNAKRSGVFWFYINKKGHMTS
jgi:hypothetical protein